MKILLADDDTITLRMLEAIIQNLNFQIISAHNGNQAWELIHTENPDIALLDWLMPGMEGLEIIKRLKNTPQTKFIYLILVTSNDRTENITMGLDGGANDYITKPFNKDELRSRISVGVRIVEYENHLKKLNSELLQYSSKMEALAQERAAQLVQADRMVTLGTMAAGIAHEISNPLTVIRGNIKLIKRVWQVDVSPIYQESEDAKKFSIGSKAISNLLLSLEKSALRMHNIIEGMRTFAHGKGGEINIINPQECVSDALEICRPKTINRVHITTNMNMLPYPIKGNSVQIVQILVNLISNAVDALSGIPNAEITVSAQGTSKQQLIFSVHDNGTGILPENIEKLWSPFFTTKPVGIGTGLGLFICKSIVAEHGGKIWVESKPDYGTTFFVELLSETEFDHFISEKQKKIILEPEYE